MKAQFQTAQSPALTGGVFSFPVPQTDNLSWKFYAKVIRDEAKALPSTTAGPSKIHVMSGTPDWDAWVAHEGKSHPFDSKGGWSFPTRWPPKIEKAA